MGISMDSSVVIGALALILVFDYWWVLLGFLLFFLGLTIFTKNKLIRIITIIYCSFVALLFFGLFVGPLLA